MRSIHVKKIFAIAIISLMGYIIYKNQGLEEKNNCEKIDMTVEWLKIQASVIGSTADSLEVQDTSGSIMSLTEIINDERKIGIFVNKNHCSDCWKEAAKNLIKATYTSGIGKPFILGDEFRESEVRFLAHEEFPGVPIYRIQKCNSFALSRFMQLKRPFFFLLDVDGTISSIFFYEGIMMPVFYKYFCIASVANKASDTLEIPHPMINLGNVSYRCVIPLRYELVNNSKSKCQIVRIVPSCECLKVKDIPKILEPGNSIYIRLELTVELQGKFERNIEVYTDNRREPYVLSVVGCCK